MYKMSKEEQERHANHVKLWTWLSENPGKTKGDAFEALNLPLVDLSCFACYQECANSREVSTYSLRNRKLCELCPLGTAVGCGDGLFTEWAHLTKCFNGNNTWKKDKLRHIARQIAELEWKPQKQVIAEFIERQRNEKD